MKCFIQGQVWERLFSCLFVFNMLVFTMAVIYKLFFITVRVLLLVLMSLPPELENNWLLFCLSSFLDFTVTSSTPILEFDRLWQVFGMHWSLTSQWQVSVNLNVQKHCSLPMVPHRLKPSALPCTLCMLIAVNGCCLLFSFKDAVTFTKI